MYSSETWTILKTVMKRMEAFEMWIWRKMEKISWTAKVSNSEVLNQVEENSCIINTINQQKCRWLGHVLRHDVLLRDILEGRMTGKCTRGRKRLQLMSNIHTHTTVLRLCGICLENPGEPVPEEEMSDSEFHGHQSMKLQFSYEIMFGYVHRNCK